MSQADICSNRRARYDYTILEQFEAGLVLLGPEVKAIRAHQISIAEGWVRLQNGEAHLIDVNITCKAGGWAPIDPLRVRKLLLKKKQLQKLADASISGRAIIPLRVYFNERGIAKLEIAIAAGKKKYDKRESLKRKEFQREKQKY
jgi:SsrA-binding protein